MFRFFRYRVQVVSPCSRGLSYRCDLPVRPVAGVNYQFNSWSNCSFSKRKRFQILDPTAEGAVYRFSNWKHYMVCGGRISIKWLLTKFQSMSKTMHNPVKIPQDWQFTTYAYLWHTTLSCCACLTALMPDEAGRERRDHMLEIFKTKLWVSS